MNLRNVARWNAADPKMLNGDAGTNNVSSLSSISGSVISKVFDWSRADMWSVQAVQAGSLVGTIAVQVTNDHVTNDVCFGSQAQEPFNKISPSTGTPGGLENWYTISTITLLGSGSTTAAYADLQAFNYARFNVNVSSGTGPLLVSSCVKEIH
jgi:hypothetical protein